MATSMLVQPSAAILSGIRVILCEPDDATRRQLRSFIDMDSVLRVAAETASWQECEAAMEELGPELVIARAELIPGDWGRNNLQDSFLPVMIELRTLLGPTINIGNRRILHIPLVQEFVGKCLDQALAEIYDRKAKQLLYLVDRYIAGSNSSPTYRSTLVAELEGRSIEVGVDSILSIIAARKYVTIHTHSGRFLLREALHSLAEKLDPRIFVRIHRSIIINRKQLDKTTPITEKSTHIVLSNGTRYPIGPNYRDTVPRIPNGNVSGSLQ